jgi:hypothetical protein
MQTLPWKQVTTPRSNNASLPQAQPHTKRPFVKNHLSPQNPGSQHMLPASTGLTRPADYCLMVRRNERYSYDEFGFRLQTGRSAIQQAGFSPGCVFGRYDRFCKNGSGPQMEPLRTSI